MKHKSPLNLLAFAALTLAGMLSVLTRPAAAHFVWIAQDAKSGEVRVYFAEGPEADQTDFLQKIKPIKLHQLDNGNWKPTGSRLVSDGDEGWLVATDYAGGREVIGDITYGLFTRGEKSMLLHYSAKYARLAEGQSLQAVDAKTLPLDIQAELREGKLHLQVLYRGKPAAKAEVVVDHSAGEIRDLETDAEGRLTVASVPGQFLIRAKGGSTEPGQLDGKDYSEQRNYCTLVLDVADAKAAAVTPSSKTSTMASTQLKSR